MKTLSLSLLAAFVASSAAFASDLDFALVNQTGRSFEALYISPSTEKAWPSNLLAEGDVLKAGDTQKIEFTDAPAEAKWDINVVDDEGLAVNFDDVNLIDVKKIVLKEENGQVTAVVE